VVVGVGLVAAGLLTRRTRESARPARSATSRPAHR
jgi:hypothetical protein